MKEFADLVMSGNNIQTSSLDSRKRVLDVGGNDGSRARSHFSDHHITTLDIKSGWDVMKLGLPYGDWDVIFANHFIEHIFDPDYFLDECRKVMGKTTVLEIGTPNLAAWFNRIFFLFGYIPHSIELSKRHNVGKPFDWNNEPLGGHIYVYTVPALLQLLSKHHFKVISVEGEHSTFPCHPIVSIVDKILTKLNVNLSSAFRVKCLLS